MNFSFPFVGHEEQKTRGENGPAALRGRRNGLAVRMENRNRPVCFQKCHLKENEAADFQPFQGRRRARSVASGARSVDLRFGASSSDEHSWHSGRGF
jgi:hypothetical protein